MARKRLVPTMSKVYQIKIQLAEVKKPTVQRVVWVQAEDTLLQLHKVIQGAMGWTYSHLHQFNVGDKIYELPMEGYDEEYEDERECTIEQAFEGSGLKEIVYIYDLGDNWHHDLTLEAVLEAEPNQTYPKLLKGKGACPPEDCGGCFGYENLKEILADPKHEDYNDMIEWLGFDEGEFLDVNQFDLKDHQAYMMEIYEDDSLDEA